MQGQRDIRQPAAAGRRILVGPLAALVCLLASSALSQVAPLPPGTRTISVSGHGDGKAKPDEVIISFGIDSKAPSGDECAKLQSDKTSNVVDALKKKLGDKGEVETSDYSLSQTSESVPVNGTTATPTPFGGPWNFTSEIEVIAEKLETIAPLIEAGFAAGAVRVSQTAIQQVPVNPPKGSPGGHAFGSAWGQPYPFGQVETKGLPLVVLEVQTEGATPGESVSQGTQITRRVEHALRNTLGGKGSVRISQFTVNQPNPQNRPIQQQFPQPSRTIYVAHINVAAKTGQLNLLGPLIEAGMAAGVSQLNSVSFTLSTDAAARKEAIEAASRDAQTKAESVVNSMGVKLGKVLSISINAQVQPQVVYGHSFGVSGPGAEVQRIMPVLPHEVGFTAEVNAIYEIQ